MKPTQAQPLSTDNANTRKRRSAATQGPQPAPGWGDTLPRVPCSPETHSLPRPACDMLNHRFSD